MKRHHTYITGNPNQLNHPSHTHTHTSLTIRRVYSTTTVVTAGSVSRQHILVTEESQQYLPQKYNTHYEIVE